MQALKYQYQDKYDGQRETKTARGHGENEDVISRPGQDDHDLRCVGHGGARWRTRTRSMKSGNDPLRGHQLPDIVYSKYC